MPEAGVLLLAHGTPDQVEEVPEYLRNVTSGRAIPESAIEEIKHRYARIGCSPLTAITLRQAKLLSESISLPVYVGMRNWKPYIADALERVRKDGVRRVVAICLAPQNSQTSVGLYRNAVEKASQGLKIDFVESWHDHPLLIAAFAERLQKARTEWGNELPVIFTAHSVPSRTISEGDPYEQQARETATLISGKANLPQTQFCFAFQSQGMSGGPWIGPTVEATLRKLRDEGHRRVLIQPVGFLCDHVEVLYDIDIGFHQLGSEMGLEVFRTESLNDSPLLIGALAALARERVKAEQAKTDGPASADSRAHIQYRSR